MVSLPDVQASNSRIKSTLPPRLVAVFVGATSGIGETTLKQFAKYSHQPRVYFIGRSQESGERITAECEALNAEGEYVFIQGDTSLIHTVDNICRDIESKEKSINLLFLSTGTLSTKKTAEGLNSAIALAHHSRARFIVNLLPQIQRSTALRRVVTVFTAGKEGPIDATDFQGWNISALSARGHASSLVTLSLEALKKKAPEVSFIHGFPGPVDTNIARSGQGAVAFILKAVFTVIGPLVYIPIQESGERHLFLATSAMYPASERGDKASGVPLAAGLKVARGTNGVSGGGVYSVDADGDSAGPKVEKLLDRFRQEGMVEKVWQHTEAEYIRITGHERV